MTRTILIFARPPRMGQAKTRLARDIGQCHAMRWSGFCLRRAVRASFAWRTHLCVTPDTAARPAAPWPTLCRVLPQGEGDLGARMARALDACPHGPAIMIGSDAPAIDRAHISAAFGWLRQERRAAFGPAPDGGFWLMGVSAAMRRRGIRLTPVRWSTRHALSDVLSLLPGDTRIRYLPSLTDLDDGPSLAVHLCGPVTGPVSQSILPDRTR